MLLILKMKQLMQHILNSMVVTIDLFKIALEQKNPLFLREAAAEEKRGGLCSVFG